MIIDRPRQDMELDWDHLTLLYAIDPLTGGMTTAYTIYGKHRFTFDVVVTIPKHGIRSVWMHPYSDMKIHAIPPKGDKMAYARQLGGFLCRVVYVEEGKN